MPLSSRIYSFIRQNVVGLVALFVALGGSAYAANTVGSTDIIDGEVRNADIANGAVNRDKLAAGSVTREKINNGAINSDKLAVDAVTAAKLAPNAVTGAEVADTSLSGADVVAGSLGTGQINEADLFNDDSLDAGDVANNSPLGSAEINEGNLSVVEGASNLDMFFGREQLTNAEAGPSSVIFAPGRVNVLAEKDSTHKCRLSLFNSPLSGVSLTFVRQVTSGSTVTMTDGTVGINGADSTPFSSTPFQVHWQAWAPGDANAAGRVVSVDATARPSGTTCDFAATMTAGA